MEGFTYQMKYLFLNKICYQALKAFSYNELALEILHPFMDDFLNREDLESIINEAYSTFRIKNVVQIQN